MGQAGALPRENYPLTARRALAFSLAMLYTAEAMRPVQFRTGLWVWGVLGFFSPFWFHLLWCFIQLIHWCHKRHSLVSYNSCLFELVVAVRLLFITAAGTKPLRCHKPSILIWHNTNLFKFGGENSIVSQEPTYKYIFSWNCVIYF